MTRFNSNHDDAAKQQPGNRADVDGYIIEEEFDDMLDRELFAIRETLTDFRNI